MPPTEKNKLQEDTNLGASIPQMFSGTKVHYSGLMYQTKLWAVDIFFKIVIMVLVCKRFRQSLGKNRTHLWWVFCIP